MTKMSVCIFSYSITKGMKSYGPKGLLHQKSKELINCQIDSLAKLTQSLYIVKGFGAEKLTKKIDAEHIEIYNNRYETSNEGHALRLILLEPSIENLLVIGDGIIIGIDNIELKYSQILCTKKNKNNASFNLGCITDVETGYLEHIFYDIGEYVWCESLLITKNELDIIRKYINQNKTENMFLFEIINESVKYGARYKLKKITNKQVKKIQSIKDNKKVKIIQ